MLIYHSDYLSINSMSKITVRMCKYCLTTTRWKSSFASVRGNKAILPKPEIKLGSFIYLLASTINSLGPWMERIISAHTTVHLRNWEESLLFSYWSVLRPFQNYAECHEDSAMNVKLTLVQLYLAQGCYLKLFAFLDWCGWIVITTVNPPWRKK